MHDLVIKSNNVVLGKKMRRAFVGIKDGLIAEIADELTQDMDCLVKDVGNKIVMSGIIDPHVHINEPGRTDWEGFDTATKAAIAGGITTVMDMPLNSSPVTTSVHAFESKVSATIGQLHTNCGFWGGIVPGNESEIEPLAKAGAAGFKAFLTHSGIDEFPNVTETDLRRAMPIIATTNLPLLVHCELSKQQQLFLEPRSYQQYLLSRPRQWEDQAIELMIRLCEEYRCPTHIVHLSSSNSIDQIKRAKERGLPITVETAQHYLFFCAEDIHDGQSQFKCAPPIREKENNDILWQALQAEIIDFVATDHSPAPPELKKLQAGDFTAAWGGIASLQLALPALWTVARTRSTGPVEIAKWLAENPAKLTGIQSKGKIEKGMDADILIWDPEKKFRVTEDIIQHRHKVTPYLNRELYGVIEQTYLSGKLVFENGNFAALNQGKIITRH